MDIKITKKQAVRLFGSQSEVARALGITRQAVWAWPDKGPIPEAPALKIRYQLRPEHFESKKNAKGS